MPAPSNALVFARAELDTHPMKLLPVLAAVFTLPALLIAADLSPDTVKFAGLPPDRAAQEATLPPGFAMKLFAAEPDIVQPIAFCLDDRARLWVVESHTYPQRTGAPPQDDHADGADRRKPTDAQLKDILGGKDRILVFEDIDGDGHFDRRTVFMDGLNLVSGIEKGFGGIYVGADRKSTRLNSSHG